MQFPIIKDIIKASGKEEYSKYLAFMPDLKQERTKKFTTIVLTLVASIILSLFAINPTISTIAGLQKQIDDNKSVSYKLQQKITDLSTLQQKYNNIQNDLTAITDAIPTSAQVPLLVAQIQTVAKNSNVKLDQFQTFSIDFSKENSTSKNYSSFEFGLSVEGSYQQLTDFMDNLVNFQRIITIADISISKLNTADSNGALQLSLKGAALFKE
jgi:type IV pilus assembly protein PilO